MGIFLPQRWRQQPQGPVQVDWGHPLARGLVIALSPVIQQAVQSANVPVRPAVFRRGGAVGWHSDNADSQSSIPRVSLGRDVTASNWTAHLLANHNFSVGNGFQTAMIASQGDSHKLLHFFCSSGWANAVYCPGLSDTTNSGVQLSTLSSSRVHFSFSASAEELMVRRYIDGALYWSNALSGAPTATIDNVRLFRRVDYPDPSLAGNAVALGLIYAVAQSASEHAAVAEHPWQIFKPQRPIIYSLPTTGPLAPTLSLPGVIDITASSARPQVTITH